jgi:hypothetical protein
MLKQLIVFATGQPHCYNQHLLSSTGHAETILLAQHLRDIETQLAMNFLCVVPEDSVLAMQTMDVVREVINDEWARKPIEYTTLLKAQNMDPGNILAAFNRQSASQCGLLARMAIVVPPNQVLDTMQGMIEALRVNVALEAPAIGTILGHPPDAMMLYVPTQQMWEYRCSGLVDRRQISRQNPPPATHGVDDNHIPF